MENKKTAIDWFMENLPERLRNSIINGYGDTLTKAKEIFQDQVEEAYWDGGQDVPVHGNQCNIYYENNYKKNN
jgi:hypothetical protein